MTPKPPKPLQPFVPRNRILKFAACALALITWYLLTPPYVGLQKFDLKAPLSKWYEAVDFDSLADCQRYRTGIIEQYRKNTMREDPSAAEASVKMFESSQCISSDDPRRNEE